MVNTFGIDDLVNHGAVLGREVVQACDINFVDDEDGGFVREEGLDGMEEFALRTRMSKPFFSMRSREEAYLCFYGISTLLAEIHEIQNT